MASRREETGEVARVAGRRSTCGLGDRRCSGLAFQPGACRASWRCLVVASFAQDKRVIQGLMFVEPAVI